ncbi:SAM-dependent methyltransferase [Methylobacterium sp. BE186]|uniref:class I SAM-dependent methyltransferase n=1 Tax=Methylobacterium sp. BE186 TaxID=2817715 RepID=UPI00285FDCD8|nr:class I SAM-dependent methyltransferase [Methylobacterium sp. BE186]MDR7038325.1 SAM-dependent methyltransferase [Methylobacterium sp. BE186]
MTNTTDRDTFGVRQAEMTARWFENVKRQHGDVDAYIRTRFSAYIDRWKEAARFIPNGSRVLDIGGGNLFEDLVRFLADRKYVYQYIDVDPSSVASSQALARSLGIDSFTFQHGFNDVLPFQDSGFDAVFSSHCIEHSFNLPATFSEIRRVLAGGGNLCMAVPFGWEVNPEHPYFFGPNEWLALLRQAGFRIRTAQIGSEYPENGYDFFISAQRLDSLPNGPLLDPEDFRKTNFNFIAFDSDQIKARETPIIKDDHFICQGDNWEINVLVPKGAREICPIMLRHEWSGSVQLSCENVASVEDLYSWFSYVQPIRLRFEAPLAQDSFATLRPIGRNLASASSEGVLYGVLYR